jgi:oligoendopeptidase F
MQSMSALKLRLAAVIALAVLTLSAVRPAFAEPGYTPDANVDRSAVPAQYHWKLEALFKSDATFQAGLLEAAGMRQKLAAYRGTLAAPEKLAACLELYFKTRHLTNRLTLYANLQLQTDEKSTRFQGFNEQALQAMNGLMDVASFIRREVLAMSDATLAKALRAQPRLTAYQPYISEMRRRRSRVLSASSEKILSMAGDVLWAEIDINEIPSGHEKTFQALRADLILPHIKDEQGKSVQLTLSNFGKYRASADRSVRQGAVQALFSTLRKFQHAYASTFAGQVRLNVLLARARGYRTAMEAFLDKDNISPEVYRNLLRTIHANLAPLQRYIAMRRKVMGLDSIHIYDLYSPLVKGVERKIPYEQARQMIPEALACLGPDYVRVLREGLDPASGWVDVYPHRDKDSGASCNFVWGVHPYVKLNYFDDLYDVSTAAHEMGHALHSYLSMTKQPYVTANYVPFLAEIASTTNEKLLGDYLLAHAKDDDERLFVLNEGVERIRQTIYRQALFAEFELAAHTAAENGVPLTAELLNKTYRDLLRTYYGAGFTVDPDDELEWAYIPHFYYKYYVFSYATGLSAGIAIADRVEKLGKPARDAYLGMLKGGCSKPPLELLKGAGVDLTKPDAIQAAARELDRLVAQMEEILVRRGTITK